MLSSQMDPCVQAGRQAALRIPLSHVAARPSAPLTSTNACALVCHAVAVVFAAAVGLNRQQLRVRRSVTHIFWHLGYVSSADQNPSSRHYMGMMETSHHCPAFSCQKYRCACALADERLRSSAIGLRMSVDVLSLIHI